MKGNMMSDRSRKGAIAKTAGWAVGTVGCSLTTMFGLYSVYLESSDGKFSTEDYGAFLLGGMAASATVLFAMTTAMSYERIPAKSLPLDQRDESPKIENE